MRDDCGVPSWRPCCETGASARLCGGLWGAGSCWHLHVFSVGHVWEADLYPAVSVRVGAARFLNEHLSVNIVRSEEHTSELQSLMRISYAVFCLKKKTSGIHTSQITRPPIIPPNPTRHLIYLHS